MHKLMPAIFVNHGGGPLPLLRDPAHVNLTSYLSKSVKKFPRPKAILVASAHWETDVTTFVGAEAPGLLYDYYGFPPESYEIDYPARNSIPVLESARKLLDSAGIKSRVDPKRQYDHGVFVPLKLMYPDADIPVVQVSLPRNRDPSLVYNIGKALAPLRNDGVMLLGSGLSFHNLESFFNSDSSKLSRSKQFDDALKDAMNSVTERHQKLIEWSKFPQARYCHPAEDHLMPLLFIAGAAEGEACEIPYEDNLMGVKITGFQFTSTAKEEL